MKKGLILLLLFTGCANNLSSSFINILDQNGVKHSYLTVPKPPEELLCTIHNVMELVEKKVN